MRGLAIPVLALAFALAACGTPSSATGPRPGEEDRPDAQALARETVVRARAARLVLASYWKDHARLAARSVVSTGPMEQTATGDAVFVLRGLRLEIAATLVVRWQEDPEHDTVLLDAKEVRLFHQKRARPYHVEHASAVVMANDEVSFFQQEG